MWQGDFTFELSWRAGWWRSIMYEGTPEAEATFRGQLVIMRMKGKQTIFECRTQCMLYSVYAVLGVNSWSCHGEIERDDLTLCPAMMVEMWMRKREMGDEDENDVEDKSGYEKSGVRLAWLGWEDLISVVLHAGSGLIPAVPWMVNWLAHEILLSPSFSWWFVPSPLPSPKNTKLSHPSLSLHAMIQSQPGSRSVGWGWEDMILPSREDPHNGVDPRNHRKSEWYQKMGKIECVFGMDRQSEKKRRNGDQRAICYATCGNAAGREVIRHGGVSDGSDGARPLWRSHSTRTEMFFADDARCPILELCVNGALMIFGRAFWIFTGLCNGIYPLFIIGRLYRQKCSWQYRLYLLNLSVNRVSKFFGLTSSIIQWLCNGVNI